MESTAGWTSHKHKCALRLAMWRVDGLALFPAHARLVHHEHFDGAAAAKVETRVPVIKHEGAWPPIASQKSTF